MAKYTFLIIVAIARFIKGQSRENKNVQRISRSAKTAASGRRVVKRDNRAYWQQRGWKAQGSKYTGWFRTKFGSFKGRAKRSLGGSYKLYIHKPPPAMRKHRKWECFFSRPGGWFLIHTHGSQVRDLNSAIMKVENILTEAYAL